VGFIGSYWVLLCLIGSVFDLLGLIESYWGLLCLIGAYWVLLVLTWST